MKAAPSQYFLLTFVSYMNIFVFRIAWEF